MIDDVRLPEKWSKGSAGGPEFMTELVETSDGGVFPNQVWLNPRHRYEIAHNIKTPADIAELRAFHFARRGRRKGFLLKDWLDFTSAADGSGEQPITALDQPLGTGDGATTIFSLVKRYPDDIDPYDRPILWPVTGTVLVAIDGTPTLSFIVQRGTGFGTVTFGSAPANGTVLTAGFEFDVPVAFEEDWLSISYDTINSRSATSVQLRERRA